MSFFELEPSDISNLNDADLRELVGRLCEAELRQQGIQPACLIYGGAQEAADGGTDVSLRDAHLQNQSGFIPRNDTVFQVKKHSMSKAACKIEMCDGANPKAIIAELISSSGAYIIVSGYDNCTEKMLKARLSGMRDAISRMPNQNDLKLDFYGVDRLALWLRQFPGVSLWARSKLGKPLSGWKPFGRWAGTPDKEDDEFLVDDQPCISDLNSPRDLPMTVIDGIHFLRNILKEKGSVVRITGLSGVGKTRIAQALFEDSVGYNALSSTSAIYADLGNDLIPTASQLVEYLIINEYAAIVVLDNCPPEVHRSIQKQVAERQASLMLLTIEYDISDDKPEETNVVHIEPSSISTVSKLVKKRYPVLGRVNSDRISEFSGGNARIALALASQVKSSDTLSDFSDEQLFQRLFNQRKGNNNSLLQSAEILSLVYSFNLSDIEFNNELEVLAKIADTKRRVLFRDQAELEARQLIQKRGNWRALLPHALSNRLARRALTNIPQKDINVELFKPENLRLFKSCAHRLGYLHDFEPAHNLADTWVQPGGPLHDITNLSDELLRALEYIAPVFPDTVLQSIELASVHAGFCSRQNPHFSQFVNLLRKIAYDDENFDRASDLILKFAETERPDENNNSILSQLKSLFQISLSGTLASPSRRQEFICCLIHSGNVRQMEIGRELLKTALITSHLTSIGGFEFGARQRNFGWEAKNNDEIRDWFNNNLDQLDKCLKSENNSLHKWAKKLIADKFIDLWEKFGCQDKLETFVYKYASEGNWPEIWLSIKRTLRLPRSSSTKWFKRLEDLERFAAPKNIHEELEAYIFQESREHIWGSDYEKEKTAFNLKIAELGATISSDLSLLEWLAPRLWSIRNQTIGPLGFAIAHNCSDLDIIFEKLLQLMGDQRLDSIEPDIFIGYIEGAHSVNPQLSREFQIRSLNTLALKPHLISILCSTPIDDWTIEKLKQIASTRLLEAKKFEQLSFVRIHTSIPDFDFAEILTPLLDQKEGIMTVLEILSRRFYLNGDSGYQPNEDILKVGRSALIAMLSMHRDEFDRNHMHGLEHVLDLIISDSTPESEITRIIDTLIDGIIQYRLSGNDVSDIVNALLKTHTELFLSIISMIEEQHRLIYSLFRDQASRQKSPIDNVPIQKLITWCNNQNYRIQLIASSVTVYIPVNKDGNWAPDSGNFILSNHILELLNNTTSKDLIIEIIYNRLNPSFWWGSRSNLIEARAKALASLLHHPNSEVIALVRSKLDVLEKDIRKIRTNEEKENSGREQRFE